MSCCFRVQVTTPDRVVRRRGSKPSRTNVEEQEEIARDVTGDACAGRLQLRPPRGNTSGSAPISHPDAAILDGGDLRKKFLWYENVTVWPLRTRTGFIPESVLPSGSEAPGFGSRASGPPRALIR